MISIVRIFRKGSEKLFLLYHNYIFSYYAMYGILLSSYFLLKQIIEYIL